MHELGVVENIVKTSERVAKEKGALKVEYILLRIGQATGVESRYVHMYFDDLIEGTILEGAELKIEEIETEAFCKNCGTVFPPAQSADCCPDCGQRDYDLLHGQELTIVEMGFE